MVAISKTTLAGLLLAIAFAHPGHDETAEIVQRRDYFKKNKSDLSHCAAKLKARGHEEKTLKRRQETIDRARVESGLFPSKLSLSSGQTRHSLYHQNATFRSETWMKLSILHIILI